MTAAVAALACLIAAPGLARAGSYFEYLHVEADSGAASGGHAAIRFGEETYHFQYDDGIVRAVRESSEHFDYVYRAIGNRSVHASRVDVSREAYEALRDAFRGRHLIEESQSDWLAAARRDVALLERVTAGAGAPAAATAPTPWDGIRLRGAGYFTSGAQAVADESFDEIALATVAAASDAIAARWGTAHLARRAQRIDGEIATLSYECPPPPRFVGDALPPSLDRYAERFARLSLGRFAVEVLRGERLAVAGAFRRSADATFRLSPPEIESLRRRAEASRAGVVRLAGSERDGWAFPLLVGLARLIAIEASLRSGMLVVPDVYAEDAATVPAGEVFADVALADALAVETRRELGAARAAAFAGRSPTEAAWSRFELAANLVLELDEARAHRRPVRVAPEAPVPSRGASLGSDAPLPELSNADSTASLECARRAVRGAEDELRRLYGYDLVSRNCVTEIFRTIESTAALDANVDADAGLNFVPFVSAAAVARTYHVSARTVLPSFRRYQLERLRSRDPSLRARLRESNVLTSRSYHRGSNDVFLFFTDDTVALRPLYGAANLLVEVGAAGAGLVILPFDRGRLLAGAVRSAAFSLPELAFVNIRKGRNSILPRAWTEFQN